MQNVLCVLSAYSVSMVCRPQGWTAWLMHGEQEWVDYFFSFYMEKDGDLWSACWFCGMASKIHEGHCPSQQVAEQFNSMAKSDLRKIDPSLSTLRCSGKLHPNMDQTIASKWAQGRCYKVETSEELCSREPPPNSERPRTAHLHILEETIWWLLDVAGITSSSLISE